MSANRLELSICVILGLLVACDRRTEPAAAGTKARVAKVGGGEAERIRAFCSSCHLYPPPDILPRESWRHEIESMYELARGGATELAGAPSLESTVRFYEEAAPEKLSAVTTTHDRGPGSLRFRPRRLAIPGFGPFPEGWPPYPGISHVEIVHWSDSRAAELLLADLRFGHILLLQPGFGGRRKMLTKLGAVSHPGRLEVCDLDGDGERDVLVANLGTVTPADVTTGTVEWLRGLGQNRFERSTIASGLGRVADVRAADFDADGDLDLLVGVFGWRKLGEIILLENHGVSEDGVRALSFERRLIDARPGAIHLPVTDLDRDGHLDFIALLSQQHESVIAFLGDGKGNFRPETIFQAPHPNWGSSSIRLADLDQDGDEDVILCNGDTLDDLVVKPYHGVHWLENPGGGDAEGRTVSFPFRRHELTRIYGAHSAGVGDLDGDGDLDLAVSCFLPFIRPSTPDVERIESLIWLEQVTSAAGDREWRRHSIASRTPFHPRMDLGDVDGDGDLDLVAGNLTMAKKAAKGEDAIDHAIVYLENLAKSP